MGKKKITKENKNLKFASNPREEHEKNIYA